MIEPVFVTEPTFPPWARMPMALSTSVKPIAPAFETLLLLLSVTAAPGLVTPIEPPATMSMSAGPPLTAVAVATGVEVLVEIVS